MGNEKANEAHGTRPDSDHAQDITHHHPGQNHQHEARDDHGHQQMHAHNHPHQHHLLNHSHHAHHTSKEKGKPDATAHILGKLKRVRLGLGTKLIIGFIVLLIATIYIQTTIDIHVSENALESRTFSQLQSISKLKISQLDTFLNKSAEDLREIALMTDTPNQMDNNSIISGNFIEIVRLDNNGRVKTSTLPGQEEKFYDFEQYFLEGKRGTSISQISYVRHLDEYVVTISTPVIDKNGNVDGVLVGFISPKKIDEIMTERTGLGDSGETFLVNNIHLLVTPARGDNGIMTFHKEIYTKGIDICLKNLSAKGEFKDYRGIDILGNYQYLPEKQICIVSKIDKAEVHRPLEEMADRMFFTTATIFIIIVILSIMLTRKLTRPIDTLIQGTEFIRRGKLDHRIKVESKDELGNLTVAFNHMAHGLQLYHNELIARQHLLENKVQERTRHLKQKVEELEDAKAKLNIMLNSINITNRKLARAKIQLNRRIRELQNTDREKDEFISISSHELKTPLTSIQGFVGLLSNPKVFKKKELRDKYMTIIQDDTHRLGNLIGNILDLTKLDLGRLRFNPESIALPEFLSEVIQQLDKLFKQKKISIETKIPKDIPPIITDKARLGQIIVNLLTNAVKYSNENAKVFLSLTYTQKAKRFEFVVRDTGIGMGRETMKHMFTRFYQAESAITRKVGGTGLGMAISKELSLAMGGDIAVKSRLGQGSAFTLTLPVQFIFKETPDLLTTTSRKEIRQKSQGNAEKADNEYKADKADKKIISLSGKQKARSKRKTADDEPGKNKKNKDETAQPRPSNSEYEEMVKSSILTESHILEKQSVKYSGGEQITQNKRPVLPQSQSAHQDQIRDQTQDQKNGNPQGNPGSPKEK